MAWPNQQPGDMRHRQADKPHRAAERDNNGSQRHSDGIQQQLQRCHRHPQRGCRQAAEGQGVSVAATRTAAIVAGSALMGVAGSFLTLSAFNAFFFNMVNGRGWVCVALVVFASWRPGKALLGALLFAFFDALQLRLQTSGLINVPYQVYLMLPYLLSILALVLVARKAAYPQALMKPYRKGER